MELNSLIRCELDAAFFHLYEIDRDDVVYIMRPSPLSNERTRRSTASTAPNESSWKSTAMAEAMRAGRPYETILSPPPADPSVAHKER